ncbi:hypothetical protein HZB94_04920 [Candidatus Falkowbacteria bacterium]|nr:hypothetical protein [Candidatus Falkowbacteria bacterium]
MFIIRRLIILFVPVFWIAGLELVKQNSGFLTPVAIFFLGYLFFAILIVCRGRLDGAFWHFLILPVIFAASSFFFFLFLTSELNFHLLVSLTGGALYLILHQYFTYVHFPSKYQPYTLENLTFYISIFSIFFIFSCAFASLILIQWSIFYLISVILLVMAVIIYKYFWVHKISIAEGWLFILIILLAQVEIFVAVSYLPTSYYVDAFILTVASYLMLGLSKNAILSSSNKKQTIIQLSVAAILLFAVLASAKWG